MMQPGGTPTTTASAAVTTAVPPQTNDSAAAAAAVGAFKVSEEMNDCGFGGNRWPRQETLALLKIRSDIDIAVPDASVKGPLWEDVSRKMAELGYMRNAKKCKEKFENIYKYYKRTKEVRTGRSEGKTYRFFDQLVSLETQPSSSDHQQQQHQPLQTQQSPPLRSHNNSTFPSSSIAPYIQQMHVSPFPDISGDFLADNSTSSSSSSTSSEAEIGRTTRKRKWKDFFERLMKQVVDKEEELQRNILEAVEKREHERFVREESWRVQEIARFNREHEILAHGDFTLLASADVTAAMSLQTNDSAATEAAAASTPPLRSHNNNNNNSSLFSTPPVATVMPPAGANITGVPSSSIPPYTQQMNVNHSKEDLFEMRLTTKDMANIDSLLIPNKEAKKYFPFINYQGGTESFIRFEDEDGKRWLFGYSNQNIGTGWEFTTGWSRYVKEKQLSAGDSIFFQRDRTDILRFFIGCIRGHSGAAPRNDALESSRCAVLNPTSPATSEEKLEMREKPKEVETPSQQRLPEHSITGFDPILVISCGDNQDSDEAYFISCIFDELYMRGFTPCRYDLTKSTVTGNPEMLCRSRVCVMIITMNYVRSRECLDGFLAVMGHLKANNLVLIPVFFNVSLSDVKGQSDSFELSLLENSVHASQVLKWTMAMIELTSINRYQYIKGDEVMLAKNIVRDVCLLLNSETNRNLTGVRFQLKSILSLLKNSRSSAPQIVGLWGMAGIGKTAIARELFRTQAERYDVCYFLSDFHLMCQTKGLNHLRDEFFSKVFGEEKVFIDTCDTKLSFKRESFLDKKVLIVLVGVSNARDAEVLVGGFGWFSGGHTIILTSRNRQVLVQCHAKELYEIQKLSEPVSLHLFCQFFCQFTTEQNWKGIMPLISKLVNYASGIPLALRVLGSSVQKLCINDEKQHLRRLRQHPLIEIYDAFRRSFDLLDDNEKNTFLDLACFFRGENKDHVVNILDGCDFYTDLGIYGLIDEFLISLVDNRIEMPNIFQDTGRFVVCQEYGEACKRSRLWDSNDIVDVLTNNSGTEAIEGIFLNVSGLTFKLSPTVFERMHRLRLLKLHCPTSERPPMVFLPQGLHSLPDELRLLHWERFPLVSLPRNFNPKNLVELNMPYSNMKKLWKGTKNLEKLKRIILSHSRQLTKFPRLLKAKNLEHIDLEGCTSLVKVNSSILHHHKLTFLSLKNCSHLRIMPTTVHLKSLEVLNLSGCSELEHLQDFSPNLAGTAITEMPSSVEHLTRLVTLDLENCERLQHLPLGISNLKAVVSLKLFGCLNLKSHPEFELFLRYSQRLNKKITMEESVPLRLHSAIHESRDGVEELLPAFKYPSSNKIPQESSSQVTCGAILSAKRPSMDPLELSSVMAPPDKKKGVFTARSLAERERRKRISGELKKLQELVPNMDKQTNFADMLDVAVDYIKDLKNQDKILKEKRANCKCV